MKNKFMRKLKVAILWFSVWTLAFAAILGANSSHVKADEEHMPTVQFDVRHSQSKGFVWQAHPEIQVSLSGRASHLVTVQYKVAEDSTAKLDEDFRFESSDQVLTFRSRDRDDEYEDSVKIPLEILDNDNTTGKTINLELFDPTRAGLGTPSTFTYTILKDAKVETTLSTNPSIADGENGWFKTNPEITLTVAATYRHAKIYYRWDSGEKKKYNGPFSALEGEHTLYFYAVDRWGNKEEIQSKEFKVDTISPVMGQITATLTADNQVKLSWEKVDGADHYDIYLGATLIGTTTDLSFLDLNAQAGNTYIYKVIAVDLAGNKSDPPQSAQISVPVKPIVEEITTTTTITTVTPAVVHYVVPTIGSGASTTVAQTTEPKQEVKAAEVTPETPAVEEDKDSGGINWNKLILAISILIIAAAVAVGGYYAYEWFLARRRDEEKDEKPKPKSKSRW